MTLSFSNLNEIGNLYESIAASDQEQLNESYLEELTVAQKDTKIKSELNTANSEMIRRGGVAGSISRGLTSMFGSQKDIDKNKASDKASDARVRQAGAASVGKYYSSSDNKTYANYNDAKAARNSRLKDLAAKQPAAKPAPAPAPSAAARSTAGAPAKPASSTPTPAKTLPSKPAVPTGTTAGGTTFQRRAATGAELRAAQAARAAGKGEEGAIKASVAASKPAATSTLSAATAAASKPPAFKPATASQATSAAPSTSAAASGGNAVTTANKIAAASKPVNIKASYEYDVYDLVLEYLLDNGHVDTVEEANYVMMEMDAETIGNIVEARMDPRGRPASGPMNVYANPKKPSKEHSDAVKAYDEKQKKKTPEQKKKELDDYIQRQRENK